MYLQKTKKLFILIAFLFFNTILSNNECTTIVKFLFNTLNINKITKTPIFNLYGSGEVIERSILTTPIELYYNFQQNTFNNMSIDFFILNSGSGVYFNNNNHISAFIKPKPYVEYIMNDVISFVESSRYNTVDLPFFNEMLEFISIYAKRIGFTLNASYQINDSIFSYLQIPFIYKAFHPSMPSEIQAAISMEISQITPHNNNSIIKNNTNSRDIIIEHSVVDYFGFDNCIIGLGKKICDEKIILEGRFFFPGKNIYTNIIGGNIEQSFNTFHSSFSLKNILTQIINENKILEKDKTKMKELLYTIADRIVLGSYYNTLNDLTAGISPSIIAKIPLNKGFFLDFYVTYIYSFNQTRKGIAMSNDSNNNYDYKNLDNITEKEACQLLSEFSKNLEHRFLPISYTGVFIPGNQFQGSFAVRSTVSDMTVSIGIDTWYKTKSQFVASQINMQTKDISSATQCNLFFNFEYYNYINNIPFTLEFIFQGTIYSQSIAKDFGGKITFAIEY